jgi:hypothetical protein
VHLKIVEGETIGLYSFQLPVLNKPIIIMIKRKLSSDGQQFHQFQQSKRKLSSDGQQFHQCQQSKRKFSHLLF